LVRLCRLRTWPDFVGYGFNLHANRTSPGLQYIGKVDANSPAQAAGLQLHDRIIEVNGDPIEGITFIIVYIIYYYEATYMLHSFLVRPEAIACGADLSFKADVFLFIYLFILSTRDLRDVWANQREILHDGQH